MYIYTYPPPISVPFVRILLTELTHIYEVATISRLLKIMVSLAEYRLFYKALWQKRSVILMSLLIVVTPYMAALQLFPPYIFPKRVLLT